MSACVCGAVGVHSCVRVWRSGQSCVNRGAVVLKGVAPWCAQGVGTFGGLWRGRSLPRYSSSLRHTVTCVPCRCPQVDLYDRLSAVLPAQLDSYFLANSGAEAVDNAVKIARAATGRQNIIAFDVRASKMHALGLCLHRHSQDLIQKQLQRGFLVKGMAAAAAAAAAAMWLRVLHVHQPRVSSAA